MTYHTVVDLHGAKVAALETRRRELLEEIAFLQGDGVRPWTEAGVRSKIDALKLVEEALGRLKA